MNTHSRPTVRASSAEEAKALLQRNHVGRIAFSFHDRVDVERVHYVYDAPWVFGRTSTDAMLLTLAHNPWCALETDVVEGPFDWESVVVKGRFSTRRAPGPEWDYDRALAALRLLPGGALPDDEPASSGEVVFGVYASDIFGRRSSSRGRDDGVWVSPARVRAAAALTTSAR